MSETAFDVRPFNEKVRAHQLPLKVKRSPTADTRTCDWSKVSAKELLHASMQHIDDVARALAFFSLCIAWSASLHDYDKISDLDGFHRDFKTGFKRTAWWDAHRRLNRHHIDKPDGVRGDINLIDVLEHIADCVMAGMSRSGSVYELNLPDDVLQKAFRNTVELLKREVEVVD